MTCNARNLCYFAAAIFLVALLGNCLVVDHGQRPGVAFSGGILLGVLLLSEQRCWWHLLLIALAADSLASIGVCQLGVGHAVGDAIGHVAGAGTAAWLTRRICGFPFHFEVPRNVLALVVFSAVPGAAISASVEFALAMLGGQATGVMAWMGLWTGYALGSLVAAPLVLAAWQSRLALVLPRGAKRYEALVLMACLTLAFHFVFSVRLPLAFLLLPPMLWAGLRFGMLATALEITLLTFIGLQATASGRGPYATSAQSPLESLLMVQTFLALASAAALMLVAVTSQRRLAQVALMRARDDLEAQVAARTAALQDNEKRLQVSEARYRNLFVNNPLMYFTLDASGLVMSVNPQGAHQLGYQVEELNGRPVTAVFPPDLHDQVNAQLAQCMREADRVHTWEITKVRKDGQTLWVRESAVAVPGDDGALLLLIMCENVTERRRAELALRESEQRFRTLLDTIPDQVQLKDAQGRFIMLNRATQDLFGVAEDQILGKTVYDLRPPDLAALLDAEDKQALSAPGPIRVERRSHTRDSWQEIVLSPIRDGGGTVTGLVSISRDITERKQAELDKLRDSEQRYRTLVEHAVDLIYETNAQGRFTYFNTNAALQMLGYAREDLVDRHYLELVHPDHHLALRDFFQTAIKERRTSGYIEIAALTKSGLPIWFGQQVSLVWEKNRVISFQGVCRNINDRVAALTAQRETNDRLRRLSARQEELLEGERTRIAQNLHDGVGQSLNLARLKIESALLGASKQSAQLQEAVQIIAQSASAIRTLEFELSPPVLRELGLTPALEWLAEEMRRQYGLQVGLSDDGEAKPLGELARVVAFRAVRELLLNVIRHAGVRRAHVDQQRVGARLVVTVSDQGRGYGDEAVAAGLGLVSVRERIGYLGGEVVIQSKSGEGVVATLSIPVAEVTARGYSV